MSEDWLSDYNRAHTKFIRREEMGIIAKSEGGDFKQAEPGTVIGRCYMVLALGHQRNEWQCEVKIQNQVLISW